MENINIHQGFKKFQSSINENAIQYNIPSGKYYLQKGSFAWFDDAKRGVDNYMPSTLEKTFAYMVKLFFYSLKKKESIYFENDVFPTLLKMNKPIEVVNNTDPSIIEARREFMNILESFIYVTSGYALPRSLGGRDLLFELKLIFRKVLGVTVEDIRFSNQMHEAIKYFGEKNFERAFENYEYESLHIVF